MDAVLDIYPRDAHGFVRQCAWCRRVADRTGRYRLRATAMIESASHGCCDLCAALLTRRLAAVPVRSLTRAA